MSPPSSRPVIYHITHGKNLSKIIADGCLWSDAAMSQRGGPEACIGISEIKARRLNELNLACHPDTKVGEYVPFYFCPRSVMLYLLHRADHPSLSYKDGQRPIVHLAADLHEVVAWSESQNRPWAFTDRNAGSRYFQSFRDLGQLQALDWERIAATEWSDALIKEAKQAEFLVYDSFPWRLVRTIGVIDDRVAERVRELVAQADHQPDVRVQPSWYY